MWYQTHSGTRGGAQMHISSTCETYRDCCAWDSCSASARQRPVERHWAWERSVPIPWKRRALWHFLWGHFRKPRRRCGGRSRQQPPGGKLRRQAKRHLSAKTVIIVRTASSHDDHITNRSQSITELQIIKMPCVKTITVNKIEIQHVCINGSSVSQLFNLLFNTLVFVYWWISLGSCQHQLPASVASISCQHHVDAFAKIDDTVTINQ